MMSQTHDGESLFVMACRSCLSNVLPFIAAISPPSNTIWAIGMNDALSRRNDFPEERMTATLYFLADHIPK